MYNVYKIIGTLPENEHKLLFTMDILRNNSTILDYLSVFSQREIHRESSHKYFLFFCWCCFFITIILTVNTKTKVNPI